MCSGRALMVMAIVYEYEGSTTRPSPAITRVRSDDVVPQWPIQRRIGNQYRRAIVNAMTNDGIMSGLRDSEVTAAHVRADSTHESCRPRRAKLQRPQPPRAEIPAMSDRMTAAARAFRHGRRQLIASSPAGFARTDSLLC